MKGHPQPKQWQVFAWSSAAAVGAGLAVAIDQATDHTAIGKVAASAAVSVPVATYLLVVWALHLHPEYNLLAQRLVFPVAVGLILLSPLTDQGVLITGVVLAFALGSKLALQGKIERQPSSLISRFTSPGS